jgi:hypothetical protein
MATPGSNERSLTLLLALALIGAAIVGGGFVWAGMQ